MKKNSGFTVLELIIVITIMVILVGIATPILIHYISRTQKTADLTSAKALQEEFKIAYYSNPELYSEANAIAAGSDASTTNIIAYCDAGAEWNVYGNSPELKAYMNENCVTREIRYRKPIDPHYTATPEEESANSWKYALGSWNDFTPKGWAIAIVDDKPVVFITDGGELTQGVSPLVCPEYPGAGNFTP